MQYKYRVAPWDTNIWIGTLLMLGDGIAFLLFGSIMLKIAISVIYCVAIFPLVLGTGLPLGYTLSEQDIVIRQITNITIKLSDIQSIALMGRLIPLSRLGNGGLFGYTGEFTLENEEKVMASCTRWTNVVRIKTHNTTYIISPSGPTEFCQKVNSFIRPTQALC